MTGSVRHSSADCRSTSASSVESGHPLASGRPVRRLTTKTGRAFEVREAAEGGRQIDPFHVRAFERFWVTSLFWQPVPAGRP